MAPCTGPMSPVRAYSLWAGLCPEKIVKLKLKLNLQQIGINATKIEKTGIHFKTDVFAAVAVVDAKAP